MSIEQNLERIADALEALVEYAAVADGSEAVVDAEPSASGGPKATRKTSKKKAASKKTKAGKALDEKKADAEATAGESGDGVTREDVQAALVDFVKSGPGKAAAKEIFEEFKAGSISTLDDESYEAFVFRLKEVAAGG